MRGVSYMHLSHNIPLNTIVWVEENNYSTLMVKVLDKYFKLIQQSSQPEVFVSKNAEGGIILQIHANTMLDCVYSATFSAIDNQKEEPSRDLLYWLLDQLRVSVSFMSASGQRFDKLVGFSKENRDRIKEFLGLKKERNKPILEQMFERLPAGILMPLITESGFIFLCKTSNCSFARFKEHSKLDFIAQIIDGKLFLVLLNNGYYMGQLIVDNRNMHKDLETLAISPMVSFFINNEECKERTKITKIKILNRTIRNTIAEFLHVEKNLNLPRLKS